MPHAVTTASPGLQAIILCGPGNSFPTFTANPDQNPKALLPVANRPMVWYPLEFCYRAGITGELNLHSHMDLLAPRRPPLDLVPASRMEKGKGAKTQRRCYIEPSHSADIPKTATC